MALPIRPVKLPAVLLGQQNGRLPDTILETVPGLAGGPVVRLVDPAARAWRALTAAALDAGHTLKATSASDSYRVYAIQERIFRQRYTTTPLPGRPSRQWNGSRWYQKPGTAAAAVPGTSNHGLGLAVDTGTEIDGDAGTESIDKDTVEWLVANEERFGFSHELVSEPWHIRYWAGDNIPAAVLAYEEDDDMPTPTTIVDALLAPNGGTWLLQYDGGVITKGGAKFYGAYPGLPPDQRQGVRNFVAIEPYNGGYLTIADDGSIYRFGKP